MSGNFSSGVDRWRKKVEKQLAEAFKEVIIGIFNDLVMRTPVDTGRARASWRIGIGAPDLSCEPPGQYGGEKPRGQTEKLDGMTLEAFARSTIYITNSVPYIQALEHGHSRQAPTGMVVITAVSWEGRNIAGVQITSA